jgi:RimJ/RimL family protein N-acetyltransferase
LAALRADAAIQHLLMANPATEPSVDPLAEATAWISRRETAGWFRVIDAGSGAAGFVQISEIHNKNCFGWLGIALLPNAQRKRIGSRALASTELTAASELGLRKLLLQVRADNKIAIDLYDRAGWRKVGAFLEHYDDGVQFHDALVYEKSLR